MQTDKIPEKSFNRHLGFWVALLIIVIILAYIKDYGWLLAGKHDPTKNPIVVVLSPVKKADVPIFINALGTVTPAYSVTVRTQINGTLLKVLFREGQNVKTGDLLAEIDPRPYQAQLQQYQGQLMRDQALLANAKIDLARYQKLWKQNSIAQQTLATQQSLVQQYEGAVQADEGQIAAVQVNLNYTQITSPIDGRVGLLVVDPGNYVQTSDANGIVVINTLDPITVVFAIPQNDIPSVMQQINAGKTLAVNAYNRDQNKLLASGSLLTIDNQMDPTTGTVKLKAEFQNHDGDLFPNQFVNIALLVDTLHDATVIPTAAIQYSTNNPFVYILNTNSTVSAKPITVGVTNKNMTSVTGIIPGEQVVVEGADKLADGMEVTTSAIATTEKHNHRYSKTS